MNINPSDVTYSYGYHGYMIMYKGRNIGGAGTQEKGKKYCSNLNYNREMAEITRRDILDGKMRPDMKFLIKKINRENNA